MKFNIKLRAVIFLILAVTLITGSAACQELVDCIVVVVGNEVILMSDVKLAYQQAMIQLDISTNASPEILQQLQKEVIKNIIEDQLLLVKAEEDSIEVDENLIDFELKAKLDGFRQRFDTEEKYLQSLIEAGITENDLRRILRNDTRKQALLTEIQQKIAYSISVTYEEVKEFYESVVDSLPEMPATYSFQHILMTTKPLESKQKAALEKINEIKKKLDEGSNFAQLAIEYSEDPGTKDSGGDLGYFELGTMVKEFRNTLLNLNTGEVSDPVKTRFGYHLIKLLDKKNGKYHAGHILIQIKAGDEDAEFTREKMKGIHQKIINGADFAEMVKLYSEDADSTKNSGGLWNDIPEVRLLPSFKKVLKELKINEISPAFNSPYGYHIIKLIKLVPARKINIEKDRGVLEQQVKQTKMLKAYNDMIEEMKEKIYIDIRLDEIKETWDKAGG